MAKKIRSKGEGTVYQRSDSAWRAQMSIKGTRISKSFRTKVDALLWLHRMQLEMGRRSNDLGSQMTLGEYLLQWLEKNRIALRPKTSHQYQHIINKHIIPNIGNISLNSLRLERVEQFYADLIQAGIGIRIVRTTHAILHKAMEKAIRYELVNSNPTQDAALPAYRLGEMKVLDESQVKRFLIAAQDSRYLALYHLALTTGMRQGELFGLKWTDLQWHNRTLLVQRQVQNISGQGAIFQEPKTRAGRRTIKIGEAVSQVLHLHLERQQRQKAAMGSRWKDHDLIFPSRVGTPLDPSNVRLDFIRVLEKARLPRIRFHDLRHTSASLMLNHGIPVIVVSKRLGHSKPSVTLDIYGHLYQEMQEEAARIMDELV